MIAILKFPREIRTLHAPKRDEKREYRDSFDYRVSRLLRLSSGASEKKEEKKRTIFPSLSFSLSFSEINQRFTKEEEEKKRNIKSVGTTPLRKSPPAKGVQNSGHENVARNSGKNLGAPMQKYVYIGGGRERVDTREPWRGEERTFNVDGLGGIVDVARR